MIGRHVMHSTFGHGIITAQTQNHLTVQFDGMDAEKMFRYPDAFERYLTSSDPELMAQAQADLLAQKRAHEAAAAIASAQKIRLHALKRKMQKKAARFNVAFIWFKTNVLRSEQTKNRRRKNEIYLD